MVQAPFPALIQHLSQSGRADVVTTLRQIKNTLIGHPHRKEDAVRHGLIQPLLDVILSSSSTPKAPNGSAHTTTSSLQHQVRLEAATIISSISAGGPQFILPLIKADAVTQLLDIASEDNDVQFRKTVLQTIHNLARCWSRFQSSGSEDVTDGIPLVNSRAMQSFEALMIQVLSSALPTHEALICDIIADMTPTQNDASPMIRSPVFSFLFKLLPRFCAASEREELDNEAVSVTATWATSLFAALSSVMEHTSHISRVHMQGLIRMLAYPRDMMPAKESLQHVVLDNSNTELDIISPKDAFESLKRLLRLAKQSHGSTRLVVMRLINAVHKFIFEEVTCNLIEVDERARRKRCRMLALHIVPLAVRLVQDSGNTLPVDRAARAEAYMIRQKSCGILADMIADHRDLQMAAVEAGAIKHISPLLRRTFDKIVLTRPYWKPTPIASKSLDQTCILGPSGLPEEVTSVMDRRAGTLRALAAIADKDDAHRKAIIESGVISFIVDSLKPFSPDASSSLSAQGNTVPVILAACKAAQSLSRSVSLLRTSLIDAGLARPVFELLKHPDERLQIAATDVCSNLILEVSPMRQELTSAGVLDTLCAYAKGNVPALKHSSLWALKHFVLEATVDQKKKTLQDLGVDWVASTIKGSSPHATTVDSDRGNGGVRLRSINAAGDRVDLLNPSSMDVDDEATQTDVEQDEDGELYYDETSKTHYHASSIRSTLEQHDRRSNHRQSEYSLDPALQAQRDDIALQRQALDFVRNLLHGETCGEMVSYVFQQFGQQRLYSLLTDKLSPTLFSDEHSRQGSTGSVGSVYHPTEVVNAAIHVAIHIANGGSSHKESLIMQRPLMQALLPHFAHPSSDVRVMCVWMIHSLTWKEGEYDTVSRRKRAHELMNLGIFKAIQDLERDPSLDVVERVKVVQRHFAEA